MTILALVVYVGGFSALPRLKIGFWNRFLWPFYLGQKIAIPIYDEISTGVAK